MDGRITKEGKIAMFQFTATHCCCIPITFDVVYRRPRPLVQWLALVVLK